MGKKKKVRVYMHTDGARDVMNSDGVRDDLLERVERILHKVETMASGEFVADVQPGQMRAHAMVKTRDLRAIKSNMKHQAMLKSMDAGRG